MPRVVFLLFVAGLSCFFVAPSSGAALDRRNGAYHLIVIRSPAAMERTWAKQICLRVSAALKAFSHRSPFTRCLYTSEKTEEEETAAALQAIEREIKRDRLEPMQYVMTIRRDAQTAGRKREVRFSVRNLNRDASDTDFERVSWDLDIADTIGFDRSLLRLVKNLVDYGQYNVFLKQALLLNAVARDKDRFSLAPDGSIRDLKNGLRLSLETAYRAFSDESARHKNYLRAGLELAASLGTGSLVSLSSLAAMRDDVSARSEDARAEEWNGLVNLERSRLSDFDAPEPRKRARLARAYHVSLTYQTAHASELPSLESHLLARTVAALWRFVIEHGERVHVHVRGGEGRGNGAAAAAMIAEALTLSARQFTGARREALRGSRRFGRSPSIATRVVQTLLSPHGPFRQWRSGSDEIGRLQDFGFARERFDNVDIRRQLGFFPAAGIRDEDAARGVPGTANAGTEMENTASEEIRIRLQNAGSIRAAHLERTLFMAMADEAAGGLSGDAIRSLLNGVLAAYAEKRETLSVSERLRGFSFIVGAQDWFAVVNAEDGTLDVSVYWDKRRMRFSVDLFGEEALVRAYVLSKHGDRPNDPGFYASSLDSVIVITRGESERGGSDEQVPAKTEWTASIGEFELGASIRSTSRSHVDLPPPLSGEESRDSGGEELYRTLKLWVAYVPPSYDWLKFGIGVDFIIRNGDLLNQLQDVVERSERVETRFMSSINFKFW